MADGDHPREVERPGLPVDRVAAAGRRELDQVVDARRDVLERVRPAAAVAEAPVLEVPRRPAAGDEVLAQRPHQLAPEARAPEAAVDDDGDRDQLSAGRTEQL